MRFIWMIFAGLLVAMVAVLPRLSRQPKAPAPPATGRTVPVARPASLRSATAARTGRADSIVAFGLAQQGTPYVYAGTSPLTGFDCSGFIMYTFAHFGVPVPHSTALLIDVGRPVARNEAQPGDIVVFTGTAKTSTTPGHAGIVISHRGEVPLRFVHASSSRREPFVKVSQVEDSDYERRFMQVRRVLGPGTGIVATARPKYPAPASTPRVAPIQARAVAIEKAALPVAPLPRRLAPKKLPKPAARPAATHKKAPVKTNTLKKKASLPATRKVPTKKHAASPPKRKS
ncbi:C40 family peptidase [Hymenobacter daeguensis]